MKFFNGCLIALVCGLILQTGCGASSKDIGMVDPMQKVDKETLVAKIGDVFLVPQNATQVTYYWDDVAKMARLACSIDGAHWEASVWKAEEFSTALAWRESEQWSESADNFGMGKSYFWNGIEGQLRYYFYDNTDENGADCYVCVGDWYDSEKGFMYTLSSTGTKVEKMAAEEFFVIQ